MAINFKIGTSTVELVEGDITEQQVDAIVNAANADLAGGGGVDGAIHRAGGPEIMAECRAIGGCPTGQAVATTAGKLKAKRVIHAVAPKYQDGRQGEASALASAYTTALGLAASEGLRSIAVPALGTGAYGYPMEAAARVALGTTLDFLGRHPQVELIRFVLFDAGTLEVWKGVFLEMAPTQLND
jgi:O-acetyl-ADP-ribose deacetylase (regulator of RNase III)